MGWQALKEETAQTNNDKSLLDKRIQQLLVSLFDKNPEGKELLQLLRQVYLVSMPVAPWNKESAYAYYREGQNQLIRSFSIIIEQAKLEAKLEGEKNAG
jgi:hypothetical protein